MASGEMTGHSVEADVSNRKVTATGSTTARALKDRAADVVNVKDFGAKGDGTTDDSSAVVAALAAAYAKNGAIVFFPPGQYKITQHIQIPNNGVGINTGEGVMTNQPFIALRGSGNSHSTGPDTPLAFPNTTLLMTYNGTGVAKIETYGRGTLEISGLTLSDQSGGNLPFLLTTNTVVRVYDNTFVGSKSGASADQDVILLGGQTQHSAIQDDPDNAFHGFGSEIRGNVFHQIRRAVYGKQWVASVLIQGNFIDHTCGTNLANGAAIEFAPAAPGSNQSISIIGNRFNMNVYPYAISLTSGMNYCFIAGNDAEDWLGANLGFVYADSTSVGNFVLHGAHPAAAPILVDSGTNFAIDYLGYYTARTVFPYGIQQLMTATTDSVSTEGRTAATNSTTSVGTGVLWNSNYWNGSASALDTWRMKVQANTGTNGSSWLLLDHPSGTSGAAELRISTVTKFGSSQYTQTDAAGNLVIASGGYFNHNGNTLYMNGSYISSRPSSNASAGVNVNSPGAYYLLGRYWNGSASADDSWWWLNTMGAGTNPTATLSLSHSGTPGLATVTFGTGVGVTGGRLYQTRTAPTYGASVAIDASLGNLYAITVTDGNAFTIAAPTNAVTGQRITIQVRNTSGGAMGAITWASGSTYRLAAWTNPANGNSRAIDFFYDGTSWVEVSRTPADVPN